MYKKIGVITLCILIVMATLGAVAVWAGALTAGPLVQASGDSPFDDNCGNFPGTPAGTVYLDTEIEPWVEVNPTNPNNVVATWQQDRWSNGGSRGSVVGASFDGGATWTIVPVPGITDCSGGSFQRASDPWVSFAPNGDLYQMTLALDIDTPPGRTGGFGPNGMTVSKSTNGGLTWSDPVVLIRDDNPRFLNDKNSLTADPTDEDYVYAVWDRLQLPQGTVINPERVFGFGFKGPAYLARSTNGGDSWEPARKIYDPGANNQTIGNQIVVQPNGTVVDFFNEILNFKNSDGGTKFEFNLALIRSNDKGGTWLPKGKAIRAAKMLGLGVVTPDDRQPVRDAAVLFDVAVDPQNGNLYAVWQDARFTGFDQVAFTQSTDGGNTWSSPVKVNLTPGNANPLRQQAFVPSVAVAGGVVGVSYYDFRNDDGSGELADHWLAHCHGNCANSGSWGDEIRLTETSFDISQAPVARGLFLGDYMGLTSDGTSFLAFFMQPHDSDQASGFFRRIGP